MRNQRTGRSRPVRILSAAALVSAAAMIAVPTPASAAVAAASYASGQRAGQSVEDFYRARADRNLWFAQPGRQVDVLLELLGSADLDGLNPRKYRVGNLERAVRASRAGDARAVHRADVLLSKALVAYVRDTRRPTDTGMIYVDPVLKPAPPSPRSILEAAARAPSLDRYLAELRWMHPLYGQLRHALMSGAYPTREERERIRLNLERAREFPAGSGRHVIVNAAAQRLFMYEGGEVVDSMRVVVGKPIYPTPMMAAYIRFASVNPYWYVPPDLAAERIAPNVLRGGMKYLDSRGYEVFADWSDSSTKIDPETIDWKAVADGSKTVYIRQLPGVGNAMGRMKFMFPNSQGVYLHDTPEKELLEEASRLFSGGCVRLEDAPRLGRWLFGKSLQWKGASPEQKVPLEKPVPVYITYLTAVPSGDEKLAFFDDIYGRDAARLTELRSGKMMAAR